MLKLFKKYLVEKNIELKEDAEEQIIFSLNSLNYIFFGDQSDPNYFRIILPNIFKIESENDRSFYNSVINDLNQRYKVAKTYITSDNMVWITVEQFIYSFADVDALFERCISLLKFVYDEFREKQGGAVHD